MKKQPKTKQIKSQEKITMVYLLCELRKANRLQKELNESFTKGFDSINLK